MSAERAQAAHRTGSAPGRRRSLAFDRTSWILVVALIVLLIGGAFLPDWAQNIIILALGKGLVVLGLLLLIRTGLV